MNKTQIENYRNEFLSILPEEKRNSHKTVHAEKWGDNDELADELSQLILRGIKTSTCSALWEYEYEGSKIPEIGEIKIVLNGKGKPVCIIENTNVEIIAFEKIDEDFAFKEGEGDRTLESWREAHWKFFTRTLKKIGKQPSLSMPLVCETFNMIYTNKK
jgi:uncharacterized protein YhfF